MSGRGHSRAGSSASADSRRVRLDASSLYDTVSALARERQVPGAQLAIHHGGETVCVSVGELLNGRGRQVTPDAAFPIGSVSKCFTATLAMILVADNDVELDASLGEYIPELSARGDELTLRQLLSHTSGLPSGPDSEDVAAISMRRYLLDHCRRQDSVLPPGTGFSYSNAGYVVAGMLIETITGMSWCEAMESILLRPLGIEPVFTTERLQAGRPVATGHAVNTTVGRTRPVRQSLAPAEAPAGALAVSAVDLVSLGLLHIGRGLPDLLPTEFAQEMRRAVPGADPFGIADGWGAGLAVFTEGSTDWVGHDGNADGTSCYLRVDPAGEWAVALTSNANTGMSLWHDLLGELAQSEIPLGPARVWASEGPPVAPPQDCIGSYVNGDLEYEVIRGDDGQLCLVDGEVAPLTFHDGATFTLVDPSSGVQVLGGRFTTDRITGHTDGIQINGRFARRSGHTGVQGVA